MISYSEPEVIFYNHHNQGKKIQFCHCKTHLRWMHLEKEMMLTTWFFIATAYRGVSINISEILLVFYKEFFFLWMNFYFSRLEWDSHNVTVCFFFSHITVLSIFTHRDVFKLTPKYGNYSCLHLRRSWPISFQLFQFTKLLSMHVFWFGDNPFNISMEFFFLSNHFFLFNKTT